MSERKCGRPSKEAASIDSKQLLLDTAVELIKKYGADAITVRHIVDAAGLSIGTFYHYFKNKDDLLMYFVREDSFERFELQTPLSQIGVRITELYMHLISKYMELGELFMKSFYTTNNQALSAYMGEIDGRFETGTVMARCESELELAQTEGILKKEADVHLLSQDICTIAKGCVFEWALNDGKVDIEATTGRIISCYLNQWCAKMCFCTLP